MSDRATLARIKAKALLGNPGVEIASVETSTKKDLGKITQKDIVTGKVVKEFENMEAAIAEGFHRPNIIGAIKGKKKYKGHFWTAENE